MKNDDNDFVTMPQLARLLGCNRSNLYQQVQQGTLPGPVRRGRYDLWRTVRGWLENRPTGTTPDGADAERLLREPAALAAWLAQRQKQATR
jgi:predicted DNA-binding transcriptional regulator AlpA